MISDENEIVIIGGGFAGVEIVRELLESGFKAKIILVDKNNYNFFPPLLYQVATGFLDVSNISYPFRKFFRKYRNFSFWLGELLEIRPEERKIILSNGELAYSKLILATGTVSNYFGNENIRLNSLPMKTIGDALNLRNTILERLEQASQTTDLQKKKKLTTFVVAGGGPSGVEIAGMISELKKNIFFKDYPDLKDVSVDIYLIDGVPTVLAAMSKSSQEYAAQALQSMGVIIKLGQLVKDYANGIVYLGDGTTIETENLIWTAGVTAQIFKGIPNESYGRGKRLAVDAYNEVSHVKNIYAIGDTSILTADPAFPNGHPQLAQVAIQQGNRLAKNLIALDKGKVQTPFVYNDKGSMAIIGQNKAVADLTTPRKNLTGFVAWLIWAFVHILSLINLRNKILTFFNWVQAYTTRDQPLRMIVRPEKKNEEQGPDLVKS